VGEEEDAHAADASSADARQLLAGEPVDMRRPPKRGASCTKWCASSITSPISPPRRPKSGTHDSSSVRRVGLGRRWRSAGLVGPYRVQAENSQAASTCGPHRDRGSRITMPQPDCPASSLSWSPARRGSGRAGSGCRAPPATSPPPVGGRPQCRCGSSSRTEILAQRHDRPPWSPIVPLTRMRSPGRARSPEISTPAGHHATPW